MALKHRKISADKLLYTYNQYRYNPDRTLPPLIFASPNAYSLLIGEREREKIYLTGDENGVKRLIEDLMTAYFPTVKDNALNRKGRFGGGCFVSTLWSEDPEKPDVFLVLSGDSIRYTPVIQEYIKTADLSILEDFVPLIMV